MRETEEKIWEFKKAIDAARIEAHRRLALVQKEGGMVTLEVYEAVMRSLIDLVNRAKEEIDRRGALISETGAPESADVRRLIHDFRGHTMTILPWDKFTREAIEKGEEINFSWLSPPQDLGSLLDAARHFGIPLKREGGVEVKVEVSPELRGFKFKETSHLDDLLRIVTNLATNGVKYINPELPAEERFVRVRAEIMGVWLMIIFEDNGRGMTREFVEKGYGRMGVRAPEVVGTSIPGTGTGASSVKKIAESLGGTVQVESALGEGTMVRVALPLELFEGPDPISPAEDAYAASDGEGEEVSSGEDAADPAEGTSAEEASDGMTGGEKPHQRTRASQLMAGMGVTGLVARTVPSSIGVSPVSLLAKGGEK